MKNLSPELAGAFRDVEAHRKVAGIISSHQTNKLDVREVALQGIDFSEIRTVIDLGCGFGFFSSKAIEKLPSGSKIIGIETHDEYRCPFLNICEAEGYELAFDSHGTDTLLKMKPGSVDLVLCSYVMYFCPGISKTVARLLHENGIFIVITHVEPHMQQLVTIIRNLLLKNGLTISNPLPYELLVHQFSNRNGKDILGMWFDEIDEHIFENVLIFPKNDFDSFKSYFELKKLFFLPPEYEKEPEVSQMLLKSIGNEMQEGMDLLIQKDDIIYICKKPKAH